MKKLAWSIASVALTLCLTRTHARTAEAPPWDAIDKILGRTAKVSAGDVHRYGFPRMDLQVTVRSVQVNPSLALGSFAAFIPMMSDDSNSPGHKGDLMVMGDL